MLIAINLLIWIVVSLFMYLYISSPLWILFSLIVLLLLILEMFLYFNSEYKTEKDLFDSIDESIELINSTQKIIATPMTDIEREKKILEKLEKIQKEIREMKKGVASDKKATRDFIQEWSINAAKDLMNIRDGRYLIEDLEYSITLERSTANLVKSIESIVERFNRTSQQEPTISFKIETFDLYKFISEAVLRNSKGLQAKQIGLRRSVSKTMIQSDRRLFGIIIDKILENAIENTPDGRNIGIQSKDLGDEVMIIIEDAGNGIPYSVQPHIFVKGFTTDHNHQGMGLYIAKQYSDILEHNIKVESFSERGTKVTLTVKKAIKE